MLRPIGRATKADQLGFLPRLGRAPEGLWADIADEVVAQVRDIYSERLVSVVLRGSTARGMAIRGGSDMDVIGIISEVSDLAESGESVICSPLAPNLKIEFSLDPLSELQSSPRYKWLRFSLAYSGWTVWGEDYLRDLPYPRLGRHCVGHLPRAATWFEIFHTEFPGEEGVQVEETCRWIMKQILRSLYESVMLREWAYTRDLYPCAEAAVRYYPDMAADIWAAAELAISPSRNKQAIETVVTALSPLILRLSEACGDEVWPDFLETPY